MAYNQLELEEQMNNSDFTLEEQMNNSDITTITLGERMKNYENESTKIQYILPNSSYIIRLDGNNFSKFTRPLKKPFDIIFIKVMNLTVTDLLEKFHARTGYSHSDEITLVFNKCENDVSTHLYNGRTSKILSLVASHCSVRFNYHMNENIEKFKNEYSVDFIKKIKNSYQIFDARIIVIESNEIVNHQIWRNRDCYRNAVSTYADKQFSNKETFKKIQKNKLRC